jgi:hypothetical protein
MTEELLYIHCDLRDGETLGEFRRRARVGRRRWWRVRSDARADLS